MRVLISADHHWDEHGRWSECLKVHSFMLDVARREKIDLFLSGGDIYERASTPVEREGVADWIVPTAEVCPMVISKGNHDRPLDCKLLGRLATRHPVIVEERAAVHYVAGAAIAAVAWPDRAALAASIRSGSAEEVDDFARKAFRSLMLGLGAEMQGHAGPCIGIGHFMVDGSVVSTGQPLLGMPLNIGLEDLALLRCPLVACGHIHKDQEWDIHGTRILYPGSPYRTDFGQLERKGIVLATFDGGRLASVETIETPAARMFHVDAVYEGPDKAFCRNIPPSGFESGSEIRLRYRVAAELRDAARGAAETVKNVLLERGAVSVKVEEVVIPIARARAPEVARATTLDEKLAALRTSRGETLEPPRIERLSTKVANIEQEIADAS
jgi:DNA repair exonuclease SbcCD nuclease subunit